MDLDNKTILITGGTGSLGKQMVKTILENYKPKKLIIFSRDELKQFEMAQTYSIAKYPCLRYFIGDVRDQDRLYEAFHGVDYVIHAAALKQVPTAEYNPFEAIKTNVLGAQNVIRASINQNVKKVIALSTDKAANPINLYGASKLCSDKLFVAGNVMSGYERTIFSVVRYGNVLGSRGSVIPYFIKSRSSSVLKITDSRMTRFFITIQQAVDFVLRCLSMMLGGEIFVPKIPSAKIIDVARAIAPDASIEYIGIRPGEKLHEVLVPEDEARHTIELDDHFIIEPDFDFWQIKKDNKKDKSGKQCPDDFRYSSDNNPQWLSGEGIIDLFNTYCEMNNVTE